ncbi:MAG: Gfo/Idh/MocA family oxidoreductase [Cyclobacteriaceae bacterium]|uniref:Gfo/Idh/MocA family protein n=1 Tax=Reichenbachiella sp. TaxID=2184521 RepID=UPI00326426FD
MIELNRRKFIKSGFTVAGGAMLTASLANPFSSFAKDKVKVGVIGVGDRGTGLMSLMKDLDGFEIVALADPLPFRLERALAKTLKAKGYTSHAELIQDKNVEAVFIATPFSTHGEIAIAALKERKHVYCEKTMVKGVHEIQDVIDIHKNSGLVFQTGHQYHSSPLYNKALEIIRSGHLGEITSYECQWNRNGDWRRSVPDPKWERMINWRMYREYSGGLVAELMSHQIDFINWVQQEFPEKITGFGGIDHWKDGRETFDNVHMLYKYPSGLDASFTCTTTNGYDDYQIKVLGSKATMILDYTKGQICAEGKLDLETGIVDGVSGATIQAWKKGEGVPIHAPGNDPTLDAIQQFYNSIVNGDPVISDIQTGAQTAKCVQISLDALYQEEIKVWKDYQELKF